MERRNGRSQAVDGGPTPFGPKGTEGHNTLARAVARDLAVSGTYTRLCRYEAHLERGPYRALHELQRLQAARSGKPVATPLAFDVDVTGLVDGGDGGGG